MNSTSENATVAMMMAMDKNRLIGSEGGMPWHIPSDLGYFKSTTLGKPVIMGRKTFESIGKPLAGRTNIVISGNRNWHATGATVCHDLHSAIAEAQLISVDPDTLADEIMIIGGAQICKQAMPITQRLYLTVIDRAFEGDTWLDSFQWSDWSIMSEDVRDTSQTNGLPVTYFVLEKAA